MHENCAVFKGHCSFEVTKISKEEQQELNAVHKKWDEIAKSKKMAKYWHDEYEKEKREFSKFKTDIASIKKVLCE